MLVFTKLADWFDREKTFEQEFIDALLQRWVLSTLDDKSPWYRNIAIWTASGASYAVNKLSTEVASGFIDILRFGDGVKQGGWGYGHDALRLLILTGPIVRAGRIGISLLAAVDELPALGNCTWVAAVRALRMTGVKHFARVGDLARAAGIADTANTSGAFVHELITPLKQLGADAKYVAEATSMKQIARLADSNPSGVVLFSVKWSSGTGVEIGHTLLARRGLFGGINIIDRTNQVVSNLAELERLYPGIKNAIPYGSLGVVQNARIVTLAGTLPSLMNVLAVEVRSIPIPLLLSNDPSKVAYESNINPQPSDPSQRRTYTVVRGDTLSAIAKRKYGSVSKWRVIYDANRSVIGSNPDLIIPGQILWIP